MNEEYIEKQQSARNELAAIRDQILNLNQRYATTLNDDDISAIYEAYQRVHECMQKIPYHGLGNLIK